MSNSIQKSGILSVTRENDLFWMDFPSRRPKPCPKPDALEKALGVDVLETHQSRDLLVLVKDEDTVADLKTGFFVALQYRCIWGDRHREGHFL